MKQISIIFPNQLFRESPILKINCEVLILEDSLFFGNDKFNKLWRCKNVLILDGACWPTSSWQSPTLTMMALSRRACLNIKKT